MPASVIEHGAPTRDRGEDSEAKKAEGGFGEDGACNADGGLNQNGLENIRQQMARHDSYRGCAKRARSEDEFEFFHLQDLRASEARVACRSEEHTSELQSP